MVGLDDLFRVFGRIGLLSFGGPAAQIALMHRVLIDERGWMTEREFLSALSFCMLLPGPEAMQLATYAGWKQRGVAGGLLAGLLFVLPGAAVVLGLAVLYAHLGDLTLVQALFLGVQATVVVIVIEALLRVSRRALKSGFAWAIAAAAFVGIFALSVPFPAIILAAALIGSLRVRAAEAPPPPSPGATLPATLRTIALWAAVWLLPLAGLVLVDDGILARMGLYFSQLAVVTFGGAYAVLAAMTQTVVQDFGWLTTAEMVDGLGLAETTPGPLILVIEFVGFLAAFREGGLSLGLAGAAVALWMTFAPCFLWVFAGAPWIGWIGTRPRLAAALDGITAAVVGVILNLTLWFAAHVFFGTVGLVGARPVSLIAPDISTFDPVAGAIAALAVVAILRLHWPLLPVLGAAALAGVALSAL